MVRTKLWSTAISRRRAVAPGLGFLLSLGTPACGAPPCTNLLFPATAARISAGDNFNSWVGRAVLGYKIGDNINTYASISRGRRRT